MLKMLQLYSVLVVTIIGLTVRPSTTYGQMGGWSQPKRLSLEGQFASFPDVATDSTGRVHVVWSSGYVGYDTVMYTSNWGGEEWSEINDIFALRQTAGSEATRAALLVDRHDTLHVTYRYTTVYYSQSQANSAFSTTSWSLAQPMSHPGPRAYFSRLALDRQGAFHFIYTQDTPSPTCVICYHVYYRQSIDGGTSWSNHVDISGFGTGAAKPQMVVDGQDNIHVAWEAGIGGDYGRVDDPARVMYVASYDRGNTWTPPRELAMLPRDKVARNIALGSFGKDGLLAVWLGLPEDLVYYQISSDQGRSWSPPQRIPDVWGGWATYNSPLDAYSLAIDSAGKAHLVLVGRLAETQKALSVLHLTWDGITWSEPEAIATYVGDAPEWPRIAVGNGHQLHVVWFVRDEKNIWNADRGKYQIWYSRTTVDAPALTPGPIPTRAPTAPSPQRRTPTAGLTATPDLLQPTSTPTFAGPLPTPSQVGVYRENDYLLIAAQSALPVVGLVLLTLVVVWWRRR